MEKINKKLNKITDLIFNLDYLDYIEKILENSKQKIFSKFFLRKKFIEKYPICYKILLKAKNGFEEFDNYLKEIKNFEETKIVKKVFFKTEAEIKFTDRNFKLVETIKDYIKIDDKFFVCLDKNLAFGIIFILIKKIY